MLTINGVQFKGPMDVCYRSWDRLILDDDAHCGARRFKRIGPRSFVIWTDPSLGPFNVYWSQGIASMYLEQDLGWSDVKIRSWFESGI